MFRAQQVTDIAYDLSLAGALLGVCVATFLERPAFGVRSNRHALILVPLVVMSAVLCFGWLDIKLPWVDEGLTAVRVSGLTRDELMLEVSRGTTLDDLRNEVRIRGDLATFLLHPSTHNVDVHPPLYFLMARLWAELFGSDIVTLRGLSALIGVATIPAVAWLSLEAFACWRSALLAAGFAATSPFQAVFSQEARMYTLLGLLTVLSSAALLRAQRRRSRPAWLLYGSIAALGMLTHGLFGLVLIAQAAFVFIRGGPERRPALLACTAGAVASLPWIANVILERLHDRMKWLLNPALPDAGIVGVLDGLGTSLTHTPMLTAVAGVLLLAAAVIVAARRDGGLLLFAIVTAGAFAPWLADIVTGGSAAGVSRYFGMPGLIALVALGRVAAILTVRWRVGGPALTAALLIFSLASAALAATADSVIWSKGGRDVPRCMAALEASRRPTVVIIDPNAVLSLVAWSQGTRQAVRVGVPGSERPTNGTFILLSTGPQRRDLARRWGGRFVPVTPLFHQWDPGLS